jgi:predicted peptidase
MRKINSISAALSSLLIIFLISPILAAPQSERFAARLFKSARGDTLLYRLFIPPAYETGRKYPLVLWLHGGAGRGNDNLKQITGGNASGSHVWTTPENQSKHTCFVVAPQCPEGDQWASYDDAKPSRQLELVFELLNRLEKEFRIDPERIYVTGQSMGGFGTWSLISQRAQRFAAAIPLCGGGDESKASALVDIPIWVFHGEKDAAVSVERSRSMVAAIKKAGGNPRYTEYKDKGHAIWDDAFSEGELLSWAFEQRRHRGAQLNKQKPGRKSRAGD